MEAYAVAASGEPFERSRDLVESLITWLSEQDAAGLTHADLEARLDDETALRVDSTGVSACGARFDDDLGVCLGGRG